MSGPSDTGGRRPFLALDQGELESEPVSSFTALQRSVHLALHELANWAELPWVHHGRRVGVVRRGELTRDVRSIADHAKVTKDVVQGVIEALRRAGLLEWIEPTTEPTGETTIPPTTRPTSGPTRPRKLRLVNYLRKAAQGEDEPTKDPTTEPTTEPTTRPTTEPTEIRKADVQTSHGDERAPAAAEPRQAPSSRRAKRSDDEETAAARELREAAARAFYALRGAPYTLATKEAIIADRKAARSLLAACDGDLAAIEARWRAALAHEGFPRVDTLADLARHWARFSPPPTVARRRLAEAARRPAPPTGPPAWVELLGYAAGDPQREGLHRALCECSAQDVAGELVIAPPTPEAGNYLVEWLRIEDMARAAIPGVAVRIVAPPARAAGGAA